MRRGKFLRQTLDIIIKVLSAFIIVFILYFISENINNYVYDYFIFPLIAITTIFVCGINVGRSLEKMKTNEAIGYFTRKYKTVIAGEADLEKTEFIVGDNRRIVTNKKILKEVQEGDKVHIKVLNYNDIFNEEESE